MARPLLAAEFTEFRRARQLLRRRSEHLRSPPRMVDAGVARITAASDCWWRIIYDLLVPEVLAEQFVDEGFEGWVTRWDAGCNEH